MGNKDFNRIIEMNTEAERRKIAAMAMQAIITNGHYQIAEENGADMFNENEK